MRILGLLFIIAGVLVCFTILFIGLGLPMIGVGALLVIAAGNKPTSEVTKTVATVVIALVVAAVIIVGVLAYEAQLKAAAAKAEPATVVQPDSVAAERLSSAQKACAPLLFMAGFQERDKCVAGLLATADSTPMRHVARPPAAKKHAKPAGSRSRQGQAPSTQ